MSFLLTLILLCIPFQIKAELSGEFNSAFFVNYLHDNNLFRRSGDDASGNGILSDQVRTLGVTVSSDLRYFRQNMSASITVFDVRYSEFDFLDYQGGTAGVNWDWLRGRQWYGNVNFSGSHRRTQSANYSFLDDKITEVAAKFAVKRKLTQRQRLDFSGYYEEARHSSTTLKGANRQKISLRPGFSLTNKALTQYAIFFELTKAQFPERDAESLLTDGYEELRVIAQYRIFPREHDQLSARISITGRNNKNSTRDYTGLTGTVAYSWYFTDKINIDAALVRDVVNSDVEVASYYVQYSTNTSLNWGISTKVELFSEFSYNRNKYGDDLGRTDKEKSLSIGFTYSPIRILSAKASLTDLSRGSTVKTREYDARRINLEISIQI
ncbi:MAG TPA: hypothetical protein ENK06_07205 [Gammaproteobacteria bacterium]|nr:hypothetical protein [Gammaproteobacteria bacterium]